MYLNEELNQSGSFMTSKRLHLPTLNKIRRSVSLPFGSNEKILTEKDIVKPESKKSKDSSRIEGFTLNGKVYLVEGNIAKNQTMSVLSHEIGGHAKQLGFADSKQFGRVLNLLERRANNSKIKTMWLSKKQSQESLLIHQKRTG